jgi:hypothetical protein
VPWTLHSTGLGVELTLGQRPVVVRAAILDRVELAATVEDADLRPIRDLDQLHLAAWQLGRGADLDLFLCAFGHVIPTS